jgi:exopolysaccharide biosynthesis predicted pyruvyltransferase EpsI
MTRSAATLIDELQAKVHACLAEFITGAPFAVVDFPNIRNVGDSAIWLGEIAYLARRHGSRPSYVSEMADFSERDLDAQAPGGPIFIHGGGNFGDIWLGHQMFRERLLQAWPGRPVIQFPQSIHYGSPQRADETAQIIAKHGNFTLLVRDEESLQFAQKRFDCRVLLCPDMALCIGAFQGPQPKIPLLAMLREDREKAVTHNLAPYPDVPVEDWITEPKLPVRFAKAMGMARAAACFDLSHLRLGRFNGAARQRFGRGIRQIGRARALVTDRLHVHILSLLIGRPHAVLDNSYGKIARFMAAFSGNTDLTYRANSLADAIDWARDASSRADRGQ